MLTSTLCPISEIHFSWEAKNPWLALGCNNAAYAAIVKQKSTLETNVMTSSTKETIGVLSQ